MIPLMLAAAMTSAQLWSDYAANPNTHPHIPNCSYAGYRYSERPFRQPALGISVLQTGAKADGVTDDTAAFQLAIDKSARQSNGAVVLVPAGKYKIAGLLRMATGVVLRGDGPDKSILEFSRSLTDILGRNISQGKSRWSWLGGLVWFSPPGNLPPAREDWEEGTPLATVTKPARRGDLQLEVSNAGHFNAGQWVLLCWTDPADRSFLQHIGAHPLMQRADWGNLAGTTWRWPVEIAGIQANRLTLRQPLRVDARPEWNVRITALGPVIEEAGIEKLTLRMPPHKPAAHLMDLGYNGIYFNRALNCWAADIVLENVDNGIIHAAAKNTTVTGLRILGGPNHHATALRVRSHDNLIENFTVESRPYHGINTEDLSTGNVWRKGTMKHGTFDSHRAMSFEFLRTDITLSNDTGTPGGANDAGPFVGARVVHWNIRVTGKRAEWVYQPDCLTQGALVGIQGVSPERKAAWAMPTGDKGVIIADDGKPPIPPDLFEAQLQLRLRGRR